MGRRVTRAAALCVAGPFLTAVTIAGLRGHSASIIPAVYMLMSAVTCAVYASDKARAVRGEWRVQEATLHLLELLGGWPGGLVAQQWLRHKNRKIPFQIVFWLIVAIHIGFWMHRAPAGKSDPGEV
jgi:uncharacterized membrane protein YsdA (DUF1294 family)